MLRLLESYFVARETAGDGNVLEDAAAAMDLLARAGQHIDTLLLSAEAFKARTSAEEEQLFEETVQTLGALSREAWAAHAAALKVTRAWRQLERVEARLREAIAPPPEEEAPS